MRVLKIYIILLFLLIPNISIASNYLLTCLNVENQFTTNFMIDEENKSLMHLNSFNPTTKTKFQVNEYEKIIFWKNRLVGTYILSNEGVPNFKVYNLEKMTYNSSGHYSGDIKPFGQLFECFRSK